MSLPFGGTMRHAHCTNTESNSTIRDNHSVTSFLSQNYIGEQAVNSASVNSLWQHLTRPLISHSLPN
jgi:hypothetical protein